MIIYKEILANHIKQETDQYLILKSKKRSGDAEENLYRTALRCICDILDLQAEMSSVEQIDGIVRVLQQLNTELRKNRKVIFF